MQLHFLILIPIVVLTFFAGYYAHKKQLKRKARSKSALLSKKKHNALAGLALTKSLEALEKEALAGDISAIETLFVAHRDYRLYYKDIPIEHRDIKHQHLINPPDIYITVVHKKWPIDEWVETLCKIQYWPAMVFKAERLLKQNTPQSNQQAVQLLEGIKRGMGGNYLISCPLMVDIYRTGTPGVEASLPQFARWMRNYIWQNPQKAQAHLPALLEQLKKNGRSPSSIKLWLRYIKRHLFKRMPKAS
ncbi:MAG: hypothetical protein VXY83_05055 [Pseudomonadota bacterium]|nr:hypothetical protein [Pseudomonadota bacterium]